MTETTPTDRKICSHCGHSNRLNAKVCTDCGQPFVLVRATSLLRKRCPTCGYENRLRAKVCSNCGHEFQVEKAAKVPTPTTSAKWCPKCGTQRKPGAKVCSNCGYHFETGKTATAPIVQMPQPAITTKPTPTPPVKLPPDLKGEPAPFISNEQLNQLREGTTYHSNVFVRMLYQMTKKDES
ncbi:MAG: zinc ribbon domain-containing protein [Anaerolineae bacterium]|nr:zinc ribbon domain-containing protein [Anaerolineae bacterium]